MNASRRARADDGGSSDAQIEELKAQVAMLDINALQFKRIIGALRIDLAKKKAEIDQLKMARPGWSPGMYRPCELEY